MKNVKDIMITSPKYCEAHETFQKAAELMARLNIGSLPVLDASKKVVGIITDRDICVGAGLPTKKNLSEIKIQDIISNREVHTCSPEDNLNSALEIMRKKQVGRLPVIDRERNLKGLITLNHIVRKTHGSNEEAEVEYEGDENVIKTLHSLANRQPVESIF